MNNPLTKYVPSDGTDKDAAFTAFKSAVTGFFTDAGGHVYDVPTRDGTTGKMKDNSFLFPRDGDLDNFVPTLGTSTAHQAHMLETRIDRIKGKIEVRISETWWDGSHADVRVLTFRALVHLLTNITDAELEEISGRHG